MVMKIYRTCIDFKDMHVNMFRDIVMDDINNICVQCNVGLIGSVKFIP